MKNTTKTIILGSIITLLVLVISLFTMYKIYENKENKSKSNTPVTNETNTQNNSSLELETNNNSNKENNQSNHEISNKITLYMFHGSTCPACLNAIAKIKESSLIKNSNLEIKTYEVWNNEDNSTLMQKVAEKLNVEARYIPFFVMSNYSTTGFDEENITKEINNAKNNKYNDIVEEVIKANPDLNPKYETLK